MFRHTYVTRCIEAGMSAKVLQKNLGYMRIQTTLDTYTSVFEKFNKEENQKYDLYETNRNLKKLLHFYCINLKLKTLQNADISTL